MGTRQRFSRACLLPRSPLLAVLLCCGALFVAGAVGCGSRNETQTVVKVRAGTVVVRYEDGRLAEVENDMGYELVAGQEVKVVENCDGALHVAMALPGAVIPG
jgi:hypothetical protein